MGLSPEEIAYVGDAVFDIEAGKAAGMMTVAVLWGAGSREALLDARPDYTVESMGELEAIIEGVKPLTPSGKR